MAERRSDVRATMAAAASRAAVCMMDSSRSSEDSKMVRKYARRPGVSGGLSAGSDGEADSGVQEQRMWPRRRRLSRTSSDPNPERYIGLMDRRARSRGAYNVEVRAHGVAWKMAARVRIDPCLGNKSVEVM